MQINWGKPTAHPTQNSHFKYSSCHPTICQCVTTMGTYLGSTQKILPYDENEISQLQSMITC